MIRQIFYSDSKIRNYEIILRWSDSVEYLKSLFEEHKHTPVGEEILCHLIFQCWYAYAFLPETSARYIILQEVDYYTESWRNAVADGLKYYYNSPSVCWITGFTAFTGNKYFKELKNFGADMMKRGVSVSSAEMPFDILSGKKRKHPDDVNYIVPSKLFPSECVADKFFREKLEVIGING